MIQLMVVATAFLFTLYTILGGLAQIQDNLGDYRRQLDAEGFEGLTVGYVNQTILKDGGVYAFLRAHCAATSDKPANAVEFNPKITKDCMKDSAQIAKIFKVKYTDDKVSTNSLRSLQGLTQIPADASVIDFTFSVVRPGSELWTFDEITQDTPLMNISFVEVKAEVYLEKTGEQKKVFEFKKVFRP